MKYKIEGGNLPVVICELEAGETMITESGAMSWMSPNLELETSAGGFGKAMGRMFSGESIFLNRYTAVGGNGMIAFASSFPGTIQPFRVGGGAEIILQKKAFLAAEDGVELSVWFTKKFSAGLVGGEGFILQKISGEGTVFAEFDGHVVEYELAEGQQIVMDSGHLAAMTASCKMEVKTVKGLKNKLFGGEGFFNTVVTGPGKLWIQTMPLVNVASAINPYIVSGK